MWTTQKAHDDDCVTDAQLFKKKSGRSDPEIMKFIYETSTKIVLRLSKHQNNDSIGLINKYGIIKANQQGRCDIRKTD